jgi:hypothetical protein
MAILALNLMVGLCSTFSAIFALWALFYIPKLQRRFNAQLLANQEAQRVAESFRDIFKSLTHPASTDPRLVRFLTELAQCLPKYLAELPSLLATKPVFPSLNGFVPAPTYFLSSELRDGGSLDELVSGLNDPVLSMLWEIRTPSALCEMLRYGLDFTRGDIHGITSWTQPDRRQDIASKHRELWNRWGAAK